MPATDGTPAANPAPATNPPANTPPPVAAPPNPPPPPPTPPGSSAPRANPLIPPDEELDILGGPVLANKVASSTIVNAVLTDLVRSYPSATPIDLVALAMACYHNGASRYVTLEELSPHGVPLASIKDLVEVHCTLRQFCMYYAKICYNRGRATKTPPANWAAKGFKEDSKYAAFDFFAGVLNDAAPKPRSGMRFLPTEAEIAAHAVNSTMAISESRQQANQYSNRGNMLAMQQVRSQAPPPLITFDA
uniref:Coat protein n=1 Tax=Blackberry calico virus TaxID=3069585 RepID=A0AA50HJ46_9VIRU|nr:coat protein [Blackberry calico virus]